MYHKMRIVSFSLLMELIQYDISANPLFLHDQICLLAHRPSDHGTWIQSYNATRSLQYLKQGFYLCHLAQSIRTILD